MTRCLFCCLLYIGINLAGADTVILRTSGILEGVVLQQDAKVVLLKTGRSTITLKQDEIARIDHRDDPVPSPRPTAESTPVVTEERLSGWDAVVTVLAQQSWARGLREIPATMIDVGIMRHVPYSSYRCGPDLLYEVNVYGDPEAPIALEVGVYGTAGRDNTTRRRMVDFAAAHLVRLPLNQMIASIPRSVGYRRASEW